MSTWLRCLYRFRLLYKQGFSWSYIVNNFWR